MVLKLPARFWWLAIIGSDETLLLLKFGLWPARIKRVNFRFGHGIRRGQTPTKAWTCPGRHISNKRRAAGAHCHGEKLQASRSDHNTPQTDTSEDRPERHKSTK